MELPDKKLMTIREAAASIRVSEESIRRWMKLGIIPYTPVGAFKMVRKRDLYRRPGTAPMVPVAEMDPNELRRNLLASKGNGGKSNGSNSVRPASSAEVRDAIESINPLGTGGKGKRSANRGDAGSAKKRV